MKFAKVSLVALLAIGTYSFASESLQDALTNGKFNGEIRSTTVLSSYTDAVESSINNNAKASSIGIQFNYKSADFYGFNVGLGFQSAHDLGLHDQDFGAPTFTKGEDEPRATVSGSNMYVGYLGYTAKNTDVKVGKQIIMTTLMANSNTFPLRDSFQGLSIVNKDLPQTEIRFYAIKDWYERYHADVGNTEVTHFDKPLYSLFFKNNSVDRLTLEGQYLTTNSTVATGDSPISITGGYSTYYGAFDYKLPISYPLSVGSFYAGAKFDKVGEENAEFFGLKIGSKLPYLGIVKLAYTSVSDDNSFPGAIGHVPNFFRYNGGQMFTDNIYAGLDATSLLVIPNFGIPRVKTLFSYAKYSQSSTGIMKSGHNLDGASELQADLRYSFTGVLKGLSARLQLALIDYDDNTVADDKMTTSRIYLNYKF